MNQDILRRLRDAVETAAGQYGPVTDVLAAMLAEGEAEEVFAPSHYRRPAFLREGKPCDHHYDPSGGCEGAYDATGVCGECGRPVMTVDAGVPLPTDGPDYHADLAAWKERNRGA